MLLLPTNRSQLLVYVLELDATLRDDKLPPERRRLLTRFYRVLDAMAAAGAFTDRPASEPSKRQPTHTRR